MAGKKQAGARKSRLNLPLELVQRGFLYTLAALAMGVALAFWPLESVGVSYTLAAAGIMLLGLWRLWKYFVVDDAAEGMEHQEFASGLILVAGGILLLVYRARLADLLPVIIGLVLLVLAAIRAQAAIDLKRLGARLWVMPLVLACLHLAGGLVVLIFPLEKQVSLTILGALLLAEALCDLWCRLMMRHLEKKRAEAKPEAGEQKAPAAESAPKADEDKAKQEPTEGAAATSAPDRPVDWHPGS